MWAEGVKVPKMNMNGVLEGLKTASKAVASDGAERVDGILTCPRCGTPRQTVIVNPFTGLPEVVGCMCKCQAEELARLKDRDEARARSRRAASMGGAGFSAEEMGACTFARARMTAELEKCQRYADGFEDFAKDGLGLLLYGNRGTGKTFAALCIANKVRADGHGVRVVSMAALANLPFDEARDEAAQAQRCELLVLDDLGAERRTEWTGGMAFDVIDYRYRKGLPTVVTTNGDGIEARTSSRLMETCAKVKFDTQQRGTASRARAGKLQKILDNL